VGGVLVDRFEARFAAVAVVFGVGSLYEPRNLRGITHLVEHLLFRAGDVDDVLEALGASSNAFTDRDYVLFIAESLPDSLPRIVELLGRVVTQRSFSQEDFEREREVVLSELFDDEENPSTRIARLGVRALYGDSDWGAPVGGTVDTVKSIELRDVVEFLDTWFVRGNAAVVLSGAVSDEAVEKARELLSLIPEGDPPKRVPSVGDPSNLVERIGLDAPYYSFAVRLRVDDPYATFVRLAAAELELVEGASSKLFKAIRKPGLAYSFDVEWDVHGGEAYLQVLVDAVRDLDAVRRIVREVLNGVIRLERRGFYRYAVAKDLASAFTRAYQSAVLVAKGFDVDVERYARDVLSVDEVVIRAVAEAEAVLT